MLHAIAVTTNGRTSERKLASNYPLAITKPARSACADQKLCASDTIPAFGVIAAPAVQVGFARARARA